MTGRRLRNGGKFIEKMVFFLKNDRRIDFVIPWVDGSDPEWQKTKASWLGQEITQEMIDASEIRYRDWDVLKYWFRAVEVYAPWVHTVHFITCGHLPEWLNPEAPGLHVVNHSDYIPAEYLPTFSANPIELNMHRIEGLNEQFVYFNDDVFLTAPVKPTDFFVKGVPCDSLREVPIEFTDAEGYYNQIRINDLLFANRHFDRRNNRKEFPGKWFSLKAPKATIGNCLMALIRHRHFFGISIHHLPQAFLKASFEQIWAWEPELLHETSSHRFRDARDITQKAVKFLQLFTGAFQPYDKERFGKSYNVGQHLDTICDCIRERRYKSICINDSDAVDFELAKKKLSEAFESVLSEKSRYER